MSRKIDAMLERYGVPDQSGRTAVVTGATGGLGLRVAEVLASRGALVLVGSRNEQRGASALARVAAAASGPAPELVNVDLADLSSVKAAAANIRGRTDDRLDLLVNNGGIMAPPRSFSPDGFELQWATNVLGPAALTWLLLPAIEAATAGRVVFVSSTRHHSGSFDERRLRADLRGDGYRGFDYYGRTKLADLLLSRELQKHFTRTGSAALSLAAHPGFTATGIVGNGFSAMPEFLRPVANWGAHVLGQPVEIGALPILVAATDRDVAGGSYLGPTDLGGLRGAPGPSKRSALSESDELGALLVGDVAELTGVRAPA
jgi:NAD(P)-dependent dehydrogenase (short-subunit alcohol dehydrogenase family)